MYRFVRKLGPFVALLTVPACGTELSGDEPPDFGNVPAEQHADSGSGPDSWDDSASGGGASSDARPGEFDEDAGTAPGSDAGAVPCGGGSCNPNFGEDGYAPIVSCGDEGTISIELSAGTIQTGPTVGSYNNSGQLCGKAERSGATRYVSVAKDQITFAPKEFIADLFIPMPAQIVPLSDAWGSLVEGSNGYEMTLALTGEVHAEVFGFPCIVGPFEFVLTTGQSGGQTGTPLNAGEAGVLRGILVDNEFEVPWAHATEECLLVQGITDANLQAGNLIRELAFVNFEAAVELH